jgi:hypothetical protein
MNQKSIISIVAFAVLGLIVGYAVFGKLAGEYVNLSTVFTFGGNAFHRAFQSVTGIDDMRNKILLCGAAGAVIGAILSFRMKK